MCKNCQESLEELKRLRDVYLKCDESDTYSAGFYNGLGQAIRIIRNEAEIKDPTMHDLMKTLDHWQYINDKDIKTLRDEIVELQLRVSKLENI